ncbi:hypothetical protein CC1G_09569 [Coprinopsis cinerea okayama7|uniref:Hypervirulence associated protein TUDOR domain-containing protein n=1 Tax=Coprinopsis cinerea (strain Okayama-7 / 130 / ATCC MYA-4618 / FGSC 9003) TaxID=240176 RepID=A8P976_COPC7|nr:hypothetical protein CC1G_09569 [Coprinopsis cinerea okayama7\|eukprot:XP_001839714.2 hypothetical protein CC1G_09569 [Coprinopsis cinerea okayama7\
MAEKNIQPGDDVTWNYGRGHPTGTVSEVKTDAGGKLEIETAGKTVHKNSDPENPAVHVEREGNDVVKRASELEKIPGGEQSAGTAGAGKGGGGTKEGGGEAKERVGDVAMKDTEGEKDAGEVKEKGPAAGEGEGQAPPTVGKEAEVGEKREREGDVVAHSTEKPPGEETRPLAAASTDATTTGEQGEAEKEAGKDAKKPKLDATDGDAETDAPAPGEGETTTKATPAKRGRGRGRAKTTSTAPTRTSARTKKGAAHAVDAEPQKPVEESAPAANGGAEQVATAMQEGGAEPAI